MNKAATVPSPPLPLSLPFPSSPLSLPLPPPSAGVGRTGTFIALDHLVHQVLTEGEDALVDIPALVSTLRTQRGTMVQASVSWMGGQVQGESVGNEERAECICIRM